MVSEHEVEVQNALGEELALRRQESMSGLASNYLRATVLFASATGELALYMQLALPLPWFLTCCSLAFAAAVLAITSFWPLQARQHSPQKIVEVLSNHKGHVRKTYNRMHEQSLEKLESQLKARTKRVNPGYYLVFTSILIAIASEIWKDIYCV
jgi:hypothetical protein